MKMIFKKDVNNNNEIVAFMPYDIENWRGEFTCYAHVGQHSLCCYDYYLSCKKATEEEYKELLEELKSIGYDVEIIKKINGKKFRSAYNDFLAKHKLNRE